MGRHEVDLLDALEIVLEAAFELTSSMNDADELDELLKAIAIVQDWMEGA